MKPFTRIRDLVRSLLIAVLASLATPPAAADADLVLYDSTGTEQSDLMGHAHAGEALQLSFPVTTNPIRLDSFEFGLRFDDSLPAGVYDLSVVTLIYGGFDPSDTPVGQDLLFAARVQPFGAFSPAFGLVELDDAINRTAMVNVDLLSNGQDFVLSEEVFIDFAIQIDNFAGDPDNPFDEVPGNVNGPPNVNIDPDLISLLLVEGDPSVGSTDDSIYVRRGNIFETGIFKLGAGDLETIVGQQRNLYLRLNGSEVMATAAPEPASLALLGVGALFLPLFGYKRRR